MKLGVLYLIAGITFSINATEAPPSHVELDGKFMFNMVDASGRLHLESYINSPSELTSASACTLQISADDDYYNIYPMEINLFIVDNELVTFIQAKALHIDENSRYRNKLISDASLSIANFVINEKIWHQDTIKGNYMLINPSLDAGQLAFHHLTMGQPLRVELTKQGHPSHVTINVPPLSARVASFVRKCLKLIDSGSE